MLYLSATSPSQVFRGVSDLGLGVHMTANYLPFVDFAAFPFLHDVRLCAVKPRSEREKKTLTRLPQYNKVNLGKRLLRLILNL